MSIPAIYPSEIKSLYLSDGEYDSLDPALLYYTILYTLYTINFTLYYTILYTLYSTTLHWPNLLHQQKAAAGGQPQLDRAQWRGALRPACFRPPPITLPPLRPPFHQLPPSSFRLHALRIFGFRPPALLPSSSLQPASTLAADMCSFQQKLALKGSEESIEYFAGVLKDVKDRGGWNTAAALVSGQTCWH